MRCVVLFRWFWINAAGFELVRTTHTCYVVSLSISICFYSYCTAVSGFGFIFYYFISISFHFNIYFIRMSLSPLSLSLLPSSPSTHRRHHHHLHNRRKYDLKTETKALSHRRLIYYDDPSVFFSYCFSSIDYIELKSQTRTQTCTQAHAQAPAHASEQMKLFYVCLFTFCRVSFILYHFISFHFILFCFVCIVYICSHRTGTIYFCIFPIFSLLFTMTIQCDSLYCRRRFIWSCLTNSFLS